ncbi:hypothetical protein E6R62_37275, partial [Streptomyces sp. A1136]
MSTSIRRGGILALSIAVAASAAIALPGAAYAADAPVTSQSATVGAVSDTPFTPTVPNPATATADELAAGARSAGIAAPGSDSPGVVAGGQITRNEVLKRAQTWIDAGVPYSDYSYHTDDNGKYRQDCSGFVSMAWGLPSSSTNNYGETTWTLPNFATELSGFDELQPGDMLDNINSHVVLFKGWKDSGHTTAVILEEAHSGTNAREDSTYYTRSYLSSNGYKPYRYKNISDAPSAVFTQTTAADFNGDGQADIVARDSSGTLKMWTHNAGGYFN